MCLCGSTIVLQKSARIAALLNMNFGEPILTRTRAKRILLEQTSKCENYTNPQNDQSNINTDLKKQRKVKEQDKVKKNENTLEKNRTPTKNIVYYKKPLTIKINKYEQKKNDRREEKIKETKKVEKQESKTVNSIKIKTENKEDEKTYEENFSKKIRSRSNIFTQFVIMSIFLLIIYSRDHKTEINIEKQTVQTRLVWDINYLRLDFMVNVYGQDYATSKIIKKLRRLNQDEMIEKRPEIIFLLGGPGVGKNHVINIISKHTKNMNLQKKEDLKIPSILKCSESHITNLLKPNEGSIPFYGNITNIEYFLKHKNCALGENLNCYSNLFAMNVYFVTGSIMTPNQLLQFRDAAEYQDYIDNIAHNLNVYLSRCSPDIKVAIIKFDPMYPEFVKRFLRRRNNLSATAIQSIDANTVNNFLPFGCKNLSYV